MKKSISTDELQFEDLIKSTKTTDLICELINYISLLPTLVYNTAWFFYLKSLLENTKDDQLTHCEQIYNWVNYAHIWVIISNVKAIFFLCCVRCCCGNENDTNMLCLVVKSLTSLFVSFIFIINIPTHLHNHFDTETICFKMEIALSWFYKLEYAYVLFVLLLICLIPFGGCLVGLKEYIKSRSYKSD
jgi:hypothetical protein